jgi:hypothetical protein
MRNERNLNLVRFLCFDFKALAGLNLVPPLIIIIMFMYCKGFMEPNPFYKGIIPAFENIIPPFASWWSIFLFQEMLEAQGCEIFFSYPVSRIKAGILRAISGFALYSIILGIMLFFLQTYTKDYFFSRLFFQMVVQSFFFAGLGFAAMTVLSNSTYALFVVIAYSSMFIFFKELNLKFIKIFIFNEELLSMGTVIQRLTWPLVLGMLFWIIGQWKLSHFKDYK